MKEINYKIIDRKLILEYVEKQGGQCSVQDIINNSGAEKLRVYPILFEEVQSARMTVLEEDVFGAPKVIKLLRNE